MSILQFLKTRFKAKQIRVFKIILTWFLVTRIILTLIGGVTQILHPTTFVGFFDDQELSKNSFVMSPFVRVWAQWDSIYYYRTAEQNYPDIKNIKTDLKTERRFAFFPLYSLLIKIVSTLSGLNLYLSGLLISNIFLIVSCVLMYNLLALDYSTRTALQAVKFMLIAPTSFIFSGYLTESLYLFLAILCFWLARQQHWLMVGFAGIFTSLSRVPGVLLIIPLGVVAWHQSNVNADSRTKRIIKLLPLLLIPLGLVIFMFINYWKTGDALFFLHIQDTWGKKIRNPIISLPLELINALANNTINRIIETGSTLFAFVLLATGFRYLRPEYRVFCLYSLLLPLLTATTSMPRYLLPIFPLYLCLERLCPSRWLRELMTIILAMTMGFLMVDWSVGGLLVI